MGETVIELPWPPRHLSPNARVHWRRRAQVVASYRADCRVLALASKIKPGPERPISLQVTFLPPDRRLRDDDNVIASWKAGRDGLADAWRVNDRVFRVRYAMGEPVKGGIVRVELTESGG